MHDPLRHQDPGRYEFTELFHCRGNSLKSDWDSGDNARFYEKASRSYVLELKEQSKTRLTSRSSLARRSIRDAPVLVMQVLIQENRSFSFEVSVFVSDTATRDLRRLRLIISTGFTKTRADPLHIQLPVREVPRNKWVALVLDLREFTGGQAIEIERISVGPTCFVRRIFQCNVPAQLGFSQLVPVNLSFGSSTVFEEFIVRNIEPAPVLATPSKPKRRSVRTTPGTSSTPAESSWIRATPPVSAPSQSTTALERTQSILDEAYAFIRGGRELSDSPPDASPSSYRDAAAPSAAQVEKSVDQALLDLLEESGNSGPLDHDGTVESQGSGIERQIVQAYDLVRQRLLDKQSLFEPEKENYPTCLN